MAERRQRQAADRRLISDRTAKGLRTLAAPQRVYRDRSGRGAGARRPLNLTDYLSVPPDEMELDDDNDSLESMMDHSGIIEGTRMNSDLYDAYANPNSCSSPLSPEFLVTLILNPPSLHRTTHTPRATPPASHAALSNAARGLGALS